MSFWFDKRVVLTGGGGFIGVHTARQILQLKPKELFIVRRKDYELTREKDVKRLFQEHPGDVVIHLAGQVGGIFALKSKPVEFCVENILMNTYVIHEAFKSGTKKIISIGAGCGYPQQAPTPLTEEDLWNGFPQKETAPYALAKRLLDVQALAYSSQYKFPCITAIPGNVFGPEDNFDLNRANVIPALVRKFVEAAQTNAPRVEVWGTGQAARDFVYVADLADGMLKAVELMNEGGLINLSSGEETPIRTVVEILTRLTGFKGEVFWNTEKPDGQLKRRLSTSKAEKLLGWHAKTNLEDGLKMTIEWYRQHPAQP